MRRRPPQIVAAGPVPRRLREPYVEDFVEPGDVLEDVDVDRVPRSLELSCEPLATRAGRVEVAATYRLERERADWQRDHRMTGLTVPEAHAWLSGRWHADTRERPTTITYAPHWRDRTAWLAADSATGQW